MTRTEKIGDRAVRLGFASREQIDRALTEQRSREQRDGDRVPLGSLLVQLGAMAPAQLAQLLDQSANSGFHLSEDAVRLAATLQPALNGTTKLVMIAGARKHDGASTVAAQTALALALMEHGPVLLVDCDFRHPAQHERFRIDPAPGIADALAGNTSLDDAVQETGVANLQILPAGNVGSGGVAQLLSDRAADMLDTLRPQRPITIVDVAPLLECPESAMLGARVDAAVIVLAQSKRGESELSEVERMLSTINVRVLGVVLSRSV